MKEKEKALDKVPITLRLDSGIHEALKVISVHEMRSLNTQIEYFLRECAVVYLEKNHRLINSESVSALVYGGDGSGEE